MNRPDLRIVEREPRFAEQLQPVDTDEYIRSRQRQYRLTFGERLVFFMRRNGDRIVLGIICVAFGSLATVASEIALLRVLS